MIQNSYEKEKSDWVDLHVSANQLQQYLQVIENESTVYLTTAHAKQAGFKDIPLPATYPALFWQEFSLPWLTDQSLVLTEQTFEYHQPLTINQNYTGQITLAKFRKRMNKLWATHLLHIYLEKKLVATVQTTLLITGDLNE